MNPHRTSGTVVPLLLLALAAALTAPPAVATIRFDPNSYLVGVSTDDVTAVRAVDLDDDGDLDLVTGSGAGADMALTAWENPGAPLTSGWAAHDLGAVPGGVQDLAVADLDQDGYPDVVSGGFTGEIAVWRNDGTPFDGPWTSALVGLGAGSQWVAVADLDLDGWPDIASTSRGEGESGVVAIWQNDGTPFDGLWAGVDLYDVIGLGPILAADVDRDGDPDLVLSHDFSCLSALGNGGAPFDGITSWEAIAPAGCPTGSPVSGLAVADFDGDGLPDLVSGTRMPSGEPQFIWQGTGDPFATGWIMSQFGSGSVATVLAVDLDQDGNFDLAAGNPDFQQAGFELVAWENDGTPFDAPWASQNLGAPDHAILDLTAGDLDGDGDIDLVSAGGSVPPDREIRIWENLAVIVGPPVIEVAPASLDFGVGLVGEPILRTLVIRNRGGDPLEVANIVSDDPAFTPAETSFTLLGRSERELSVTFAAPGPGLFGGTLDLSSNDPAQPTLTVEMTGRGAQDPAVVIAPGSISADLFSGQSATETLTVENAGGGSLYVSIKVDYSGPAVPSGIAVGSVPRGTALPNRITLGGPAPVGDPFDRDAAPLRPPIETATPPPAAAATTLTLLILHTGSNVSEIHNQLGAFPDINRIDDLNMALAAPTLDLLRQYSAVILTANTPVPNATLWGDVLADYVDNGGGLVVTLASFIQGYAVQGRILTGGYLPFGLGNGPLPGSYPLGQFDTTHPIMAGVTSAVGSVLGSVSLTPGASLVASWANGPPFVATKGNAVVGVNIFVASPGYWLGDIPLILHNAAAWTSQFRDWIRVEPETLLVPAGQAAPVAVSLNAAGAPTGDLDAVLRLTTNDPDHPMLEVPVHLHVTPAPDIELAGPPVVVESVQDYAISGARTDHVLEIPTPPAGGGFIDLTADGDYGFSPETATLSAEGTTLGSVGPTGTDCTPANGTFTLSAALLSQLVADGEVRASVQNNIEVNVFCPVNRHTVRLRYNGRADDLDFGPVFIGGSRSLSLLVRNRGTDTLVVGDVVLDRAEFMADPSSFTVDPLQSVTLTLTFSPTALGVLSGRIAIHSDDPDEPILEISVQGEGILPPEVEISPDSFSETLLTGQTVTRTLTVANTGGSPLLFSTVVADAPSGQIVIRRVDRGAPGADPAAGCAAAPDSATGISGAPSGEPPSAAVESANAPRAVPTASAHLRYGPFDPRILVYTDDPYRSAGNQFVDLALRSLGLSYSAYYGDPGSFGAALTSGSWDLVVVDHNNLFALGQWWNELAAYKSAGGRLLISTFDIDGSNSEATTLWNLLGVAPAGSVDIAGPIYWWDPTHPIFTRPESVPPFSQMQDRYADDGDRLQPTVSGGAKAGFVSAPAPNQAGIVISPDRMAVVNGFLPSENISDLDADGKPDAAELLTDEIEYLLGSGWLRVQPIAGTILPGESLDLAVTFDTTEIAGGSYDATLLLSTNDPDEAEIPVPVHLLAIGIPDLELTGEQVTVESSQDYSSDGARTVHLLPVDRPPEGEGFIELYADGDYGDPSESATVTAEGNLLGSAGGTGTDCTRATGVFPLSPQLLGTLAADGQVQVEVQNSIAVNFFCSPNRHTLRLRYDTSGKRLEFGTLSVGESLELGVRARNRGTDRLTVAGLSVSPAGFAVDASPFTLTVGETKMLHVRFSPSETGEFTGSLVIKSDDPDEPELTVSLHGTGLPASDIRVSPAGFSEDLLSGQAVAHPLLLENLGGNTLHWKLDLIGSPGGDLESLLASLDQSYATVTAEIPNRFDFSEGVTGNNIVDGGFDMYDGGNFLGTNLGTGINYSDGVITPSAAFGPAGRYFTRKYPGLFVLAADLDGVNTFTISGNVGADGAGSVDGTVLHFERAGLGYLGLVKRIYGAGDPSVNHLIIVQEQPGIDHQFPLNTDNDEHQVVGLGGTRRLVYLLYAGAGGSRIDDEATRAILSAFLDLDRVPWLSVSPPSGALEPGGWIKVPVRFDAADTVGGDYDATLRVRSNDPDTPEVSLPAHLHITDVPDIAVSPDALEFGTHFVGAVVTLPLRVRNSGSETLIVSGVTVEGTEFHADAESLIVPPRENRLLQVTFAPTVPGVYAFPLTLESNDPDEPVVTVPLHGEGLVAPDIDLSPLAFAENLFSGDVVERTLSVTNVGGHPLDFSVAGSPGGGVPEVFSDDFEQIVPGWTTVAFLPDNLWHRTTRNAHSPTTSWWCGIESQGSYQTPNPISNAVISPPIDLSTRVAPITLEFWENYSTEPGWDFCMVDVSLNGGLSWIPLRGGRGVAPSGSSNGWIRTTLDLSPYAGQNLRLRFFFDTGDSIANNLPGWFFDDVVVRGALKWLRFAPAGGTVAPGATDPITLTFDTAGLLGGNYGTSLYLSSNDPDEPLLSIPIELHVRGTPDIQVSPASLDFGSVVAGDTRTLNLTVTNSGTDTLVVDAVTSSDPAFTANPTSFSLAVGAIRMVAVTFAPLSAGPASGSLTFSSNDPGAPVTTVPLAGLALTPPDIDVSPDSFEPTLDPDQAATGILRLANIGQNTLNWQIQVLGSSGTPPGPGWLGISSDAGGIPGGGEFDVTVSFSSFGLAPGEYLASLRILSNDPDEAVVMVPVRLTVRIPIQPDIEVSPAFLDFGSLLPGVSADLLLTVRNVGTARLEVSGVSSDNSDFTVDAAGFGLDPAQSRDLTVTFTPSALGESMGTLTLASNDPDEGSLAVAVNGRASGPACLAIYVAENWDGQLSRIDLADGSPTLLASGLNLPAGTAMNGSGAAVLVTEYGSGRLLSIDAQTGGITVVASGLTGPAGLALDATGSSALVAELDGGRLSRVDLGTGVVTPLATGLQGPAAVALGGSGGTAYVTEILTGNLLQVDLSTGTVSSPIATGLLGPYGLALDPSGGMAYVAEGDAGQISAIDLASGTAAPIVTGLAGPFGVALNPAGTVAFVSESSAGRILSVDLTTGGLLVIDAGLNGPLGLTLYQDPACSP